MLCVLIWIAYEFIGNATAHRTDMKHIKTWHLLIPNNKLKYTNDENEFGGWKGGREREGKQRMANADPYDDESNKTTVSIDLRLLDSTFISFIHKWC